MNFKGKHIVLGVTGSIAAYKACGLVSHLRQMGAEIRVIMTEHATELVASRLFEMCIRDRSWRSLWDFLYIFDESVVYADFS